MYVGWGLDYPISKEILGMAVLKLELCQVLSIVEVGRKYGVQIVMEMKTTLAILLRQGQMIFMALQLQ